MIEFDEKAVGDVIRRLRKEKGQSQEVCSGLAGIARSHIAMIENHDKNPNFETLWKLSSALELKPHELVIEIEKECERKRANCEKEHRENLTD